MAQTYTQLQSAIVSKLQGVSKIQEVFSYPALQFTGFPAAMVLPTDQESSFETNIENERAYSFDVYLIYEVKDTGIQNALAALFDLVDDVLDTFDQDDDLSGASLSLASRYTILAVRPVTSAWGVIDEEKLIFAKIQLKVILSVDRS